MKRLVVLSGAGMSAESGIRTFRDMDGLWNQYDVLELASPEAWQKNPELVLRFYNERRRQLFECSPNAGHIGLAQLQDEYDVQIITQNIDDLHERAGTRHVLHLHGELKKARSTLDESLIYELDTWELKIGDQCEKGSQLRPHVVWFGEPVKGIPEAVSLVESADIMVVIGTSLNVYPAAGLLNYARESVPVFLIDPNPPFQVSPEVHIIAMKAGAGVAELKRILKQKGL